MRVLSLFTGIGGIDLGLEWAGFEIVGQVEIDGYCKKILKKNFPKAKRWGDIRTVTVNNIRSKCGDIDLVCGGFPCQDVSQAGKNKGLSEGGRSSLWREMWRIIRGLRPAWVLVENVPTLRTRGADVLIPALEALGYTCWTVVVGAWACGAPHRRNRVWILAHNNSVGLLRQSPSEVFERQDALRYDADRCREDVSDAERLRCDSRFRETGDESSERLWRHQPDNDGEALSNADSIAGGADYKKEDAITGSRKAREVSISRSSLPNANGDSVRQQPGRASRRKEKTIPAGVGERMEHAQGSGLEREREGLFTFPARPGEAQHDWEESRVTESKMGFATDGLPIGLALKAVGNAVVPQIPYLLGKWMMKVAVNQESDGGN